MRRRDFIVSSMAAPTLATLAAPAAAECGAVIVWKGLVPAPAGIPALDGHTDTVPNIVGRLGAPIGLAIFTEGNHFPALLGGDIIESFRVWVRNQAQYASLALDNIVIATLPQPVIVGMLLGGGIALGNLTLEVSRASGLYPDIVMGGATPLMQLRKAGIVAAEARVFARNRGMSLLVAAGNPLGIRGLDDLTRPGIRVVMASESDVLQAIASRAADVGIIFHHLAWYFVSAYPELCTTVTVPGAEEFSSTIAMAATTDPLRAEAATGFSEFFLGVAREVYPHYGFAVMNEAEFGAAISLD
jgi:hypothetical protein